MLSSHLFTSCSCHIFFICFPHTFFASCTVIILFTLFAFIYIFSSFMHLLYSYLALASVFLFCLYSAHCSFSFVSLFTSYHHIISSHILCILEHQLLICPSSHMSFSLALSTLLFFRGFSFHQIPILFTISMFNFATLLPYTSPPPSFTSLIVTISSFFYASFKIIGFFPLLFLNPHFLSPSFYIFGTTYVWPFSVILWLIFLDFCTLQYFTILHLIYDAKYVYISSLFLECIGNNLT